MRRVYYLMKRSSCIYYKNIFFLDRRNKYSKYFHRKLFYNSNSLFNRYSSIEENTNLRKHNINKIDCIRIYFSRENSSRRKLNRSFAIIIESAFDCLKKNATSTEIYLHYWISIEKTNDSTVENLIYL